MAKIKLLKIENFRGIKALDWKPNPGLNCIIGSGDTGKSSILDAIEIVLNPKYWARFNDTDFYGLDVTQDIQIEVTIGDLSDTLQSLSYYGDFLRGYDNATGALFDEPGAGLETVLTQRLTVGANLDPEWALISNRTSGNETSWRLRRNDASAISPMRVGSTSDSHFSWRQRSVLYELDEARPDASADLATATRNARQSFQGKAAQDLAVPLSKVSNVASSLSVDLKGGATAQLDAQGMKLSNGGVSVHDGNGVPLSCLGAGSSRLLIGGLFCEADTSSSIMLVDEVEHGLEPHRIIRFLKTLRASVEEDGFQIFATTHSPVTLRELDVSQLSITQKNLTNTKIIAPPKSSQGILRSYAEAFLAPKVLLCEGASEVGFIRGMDEWDLPTGKAWISASGVSLVDFGGGALATLYEKAEKFLALGYEVGVFRDDDVDFDINLENQFISSGGTVFKWLQGQSIEDAIFSAIPYTEITNLLLLAEEFHGQTLINDHIQTASSGAATLSSIKTALTAPIDNADLRQLLARASQTKKNGWYKRIDRMQRVSSEIIITKKTWPNLSPQFKATVEQITAWAFKA